MGQTPEQERQRLTQLYATMSPEELRKIADDGGSLTDEARVALKAEISQRRLSIAVNESPKGVDVIEERDLVSIRRFRDLPEALLAKGSLESSGIECFLSDDNMVRMDWFISNLLGGIKLAVNREDAEVAIAILDEPMPETLEVDGVGEYQQPRCPECESLDVNFEQLNKKIAYPSAWLGLPIPLHEKAWTCRTCGYKWQDEDSATPTEAEQP